MSTSYGIYLKTDMPSVGDLFFFLRDNYGASDAEYIEDDYWIDRIACRIPGFENEWELFNHRVAQEVTRPDDPWYGYQLSLQLDVSFRDDNESLRSAVASFANTVATDFEILLMYNNETVLAKNDSPGEPLAEESEDPGYVGQEFLRDVAAGNNPLIQPGTRAAKDLGIE